MIVEDSFVVAEPEADVFARARVTIEALGFNTVRLPSERTLELQRGKERPFLTFSLTSFRQRVRIEFDRGRVAVAASISAARRNLVRQRELLLALANLIRASLHRPEDLEAAQREWQRVDEQIRKDARRRKLTVTLVVLLILVVPFVTCIAAIAAGF